ncbi:dynamin family protein [Salinibacillus xinjiangensis]|nr:dynamin family protein [Salinibacillus xinjiangensis]
MNSYVDTKVDQKLSKLATLYDRINEYGDIHQAEKMLDLMKKYKNEQLVVGFSGHFSAGKSTMINHLVGEDILPSSPIPTSANLVQVKSGAPYTRVFYRYESPVEYSSSIDIDTIKSLCKDGDAIKEIEISKHIASLPQHVSILDTPGIDSSNDADRIITESSLHIVDTLFYVMDYNHVQSEVNLAFLQELQSRGKPFYLVVNQIDKHQEEELSFEEFKQSVDVALSNWNLQPKGVFYTSLHKQELENNQFSELKDLFHDFMEQKEDIIEHTLIHSSKALIQDHIEYYRNQQSEQLEDLQEKITDLESRLSTGDQTINDVAEKLEDMQNRDQKVERIFKESLDSIFKNAYLMPYENREKAKHFLESMQPGFKAGVLFARKKTEQERENRLEDFFKSLMEVASVQLDSHIRDLLQRVTKEQGVGDEELLKEIQDFTIQYEQGRLKKLIKSGAEVTGNYVLVYTNDVVQDLKQSANQQLLDIWEQIRGRIQQQTKQVLEEKKDELELYEEINKAKDQLAQIQSDIELREKQLNEKLFGEYTENKDLIDKVERILQERESSIQQSEAVLNQTNESYEKDTTEEVVDTNQQENLISVEDTVSRLEKSINVIQDIRGFQSLTKELVDKKERLENRQFTVALFGAFSAGKSSFANALLGEKVLPVSPNPTTATINKISPPNVDHPHGTVAVQLKKEKDLLDDVFHVTVGIPEHLSTVEDVVKWMDTVELSDFVDQTNGAKNLSFLQALQAGFSELGHQLNDQVSTDLEQATAYIADEKYACYVEWIEIFYDTPFTQKGITLVDTPGADSVNARHTDVAFEYIKSADALLFVTYYNHAFSRADREFLIQLGRVKDVFSLDKMFFMINAADLAKDDEELTLVQSYVTERLLEFGIRNPRMYPVSSKWAIEDKQKNITESKSGLPAFERDFYTFIEDELTGIFIQSALHDLNRSVNTLSEYIKTASMGENEKAQKKRTYEEDQKQAIDTVEGVTSERYQQSITQELEELTYYIHQRVFLRFADLIKESINPATIQSNGKKGKQELATAIRQLLQYMQNDLIQELQATGLRLETFMQKQLNKIVEEVQDNSLFQAYELTFPDHLEYNYESPQVELKLNQIDMDHFKDALAQFKNTKSFFERNEKEDVKETIQSILKPMVKEQLEEQRDRMKQDYLAQWDQTFEYGKDLMKDTIQNYFDGLLYSMSAEVDLNELQNKYKQLQSQARI